MPFLNLIMNMSFNYLITLLNILKIKFCFLISCESICRHYIIPTMADWSFVYCYVFYWGLDQFYANSFVNWGMRMCEIGEETLWSVAKAVKPYQWTFWYSIWYCYWTVLNISVYLWYSFQFHIFHNYILQNL